MDRTSNLYMLNFTLMLMFLLVHIIISRIISEVAVAIRMRSSLFDDSPTFNVAPWYLKVSTFSIDIPSRYIFAFIYNQTFILL